MNNKLQNEKSRLIEENIQFKEQQNSKMLMNNEMLELKQEISYLSKANVKLKYENSKLPESINVIINIGI